MTQAESLNNALARIAELEAALQNSDRAARSANQELQYFVYAASHDLQEPLRAITTYSQLLDRLYTGDAQTREITGFITIGVARMNALLQSLLLFSRLNLSPPLRTVNLNSSLQSALFKLAPSIQESGANIRAAELPEIDANETQISQLFEQVLSNAILYRRDKPIIEIGAEQHEIDGDAAQVILIKDNGTGIDPQFLEQVVQPFKRLHGKGVPGNGLGLAICEKIMRAHNGKLWLESDGANGTTVYLAFQT